MGTLCLEGGFCGDTGEIEDSARLSSSLMTYLASLVARPSTSTLSSHAAYHTTPRLAAIVHDVPGGSNCITKYWCIHEVIVLHAFTPPGM